MSNDTSHTTPTMRLWNAHDLARQLQAIAVAVSRAESATEAATAQLGGLTPDEQVDIRRLCGIDAARHGLRIAAILEAVEAIAGSWYPSQEGETAHICMRLLADYMKNSGPLEAIGDVAQVIATQYRQDHGDDCGCPPTSPAGIEALGAVSNGGWASAASDALDLLRAVYPELDPASLDPATLPGGCGDTADACRAGLIEVVQARRRRLIVEACDQACG